MKRINDSRPMSGWLFCLLVVIYYVVGWMYVTNLVNRLRPDAPDAERGGAIVVGAIVWPLLGLYDVAGFIGRMTR